MWCAQLQVGHICHVLCCQSSGVIIGEGAEGSSEPVCAENCYQAVFSRSKASTAVAANTRSVQDQAGKNSSLAEAVEEIPAVGGYWRGESVLFKDVAPVGWPHICELAYSRAHTDSTE